MENSLRLHYKIVNILDRALELTKFDFMSRDSYIRLMLVLFSLRRFECLNDSVCKESELGQIEKSDDEIILTKSRYSLNLISASNDSVVDKLIDYFDSLEQGPRDLLQNIFGPIEIIRLRPVKSILLVIIKSIGELDLYESSFTKDEMDGIIRLMISRLESDHTMDVPSDVSSLVTKLLFTGTDLDSLENRKIVISDYSFGTGSMMIESIRYLRNFGVDEGGILIEGMEQNQFKYSVGRLRLDLFGAPTKGLINESCINEYGEALIKTHYMAMKPELQEDLHVNKDKSKIDGTKDGIRFIVGIPDDPNDLFYLYLQHAISVLTYNGSIGRACLLSTAYPLIEKTGAKNRNTINIRGWLLEGNHLEAVIKLPKELFYQTKIEHYIWVISSKCKEHPGSFGSNVNRIKFIDGSSLGEKMIKSIRNKSIQIIEENIQMILDTYESSVPGDLSKIVDKKDINIESDWRALFT